MNFLDLLYIYTQYICIYICTVYIYIYITQLASSIILNALLNLYSIISCANVSFLYYYLLSLFVCFFHFKCLKCLT